MDGASTEASTQPDVSSSLVRWFGRSPPAWLVVIAALLSADFVYIRSAPYPCSRATPFVTCVVWPVLVVVGADYIIRVIACATRRTFAWRCWKWYVPPVVASLVILSLATDFFLRWRFERSRLAFESAAEQLLQGKATTVVSVEQMHRGDGWPQFDNYRQRIGSYDVDQVAVFPNEGVVCFMTGGFFRAGWGFLYESKGGFPQIRDFLTRPLSPHWSKFCFDKP